MKVKIRQENCLITQFYVVGQIGPICIGVATGEIHEYGGEEQDENRS